MKKTAIIAGAAGIAGIAAIGITYTVCVQSKEPTFEREHWPWAKVPLTVGGPDARESGVAEGLGMWNDAAGCALFRYAPDDPSPDVIVEDVGEQPGDVGPDGRRRVEGAYLRFRPGEQPLGIVQLHNAVGSRLRMCSVAHGLGHVLGLAHDGFTASIMYDYACELADEMPGPRPTDKDGAALAAEYCR